MDHDPGGAYPLSVAASWPVAFDRLALDDPSGRDLLTGWCGAEPVPLSLLTNATLTCSGIADAHVSMPVFW